MTAQNINVAKVVFMERSPYMEIGRETENYACSKNVSVGADPMKEKNPESADFTSPACGASEC